MRDKTLVGIVTESDIFDTFLDMMGLRGPGRRLRLELPDIAGSLADVTRIISAYDCNISNIVYFGDGALIVRLEDGSIEDAVAELKKAGYLA
jgi:acetoin utilization protein AcuB